MVFRKLMMALSICLIGGQVMAMKRHAGTEFNLSCKKPKLNSQISLHNMVEANDLNAFQAAISNNADVNERDEDGYPLFYNVACGNIGRESHRDQFFEVLVKNNVDVNAQTPTTGFSALHYAVSEGNMPLIKQLLAINANPNVEDDDSYVPLDHISNHTEINQIEIAQLLADKTDLTHETKDGNTVLHNIGLHEATVEFLVLKNANLIDHINDSGETPYQFLRGNGRTIRSIKNIETAREEIIMPALIPVMKPTKFDDQLPHMQPCVTKSILNRQITGK